MWFRMGNTCTPMADSCQCMAKPLQYCKLISLQQKLKKKKKKKKGIRFRPKDMYKLKVRGWKNIFHANGKQKKAGIEIFIIRQNRPKIKNITRVKEGHYMMIKGSIQEEDITIANIYATDIGTPRYIRTNTNKHKRRN